MKTKVKVVEIQREVVEVVCVDHLKILANDVCLEFKGLVDGTLTIDGVEDKAWSDVYLTAKLGECPKLMVVRPLNTPSRAKQVELNNAISDCQKKMQERKDES